MVLRILLFLLITSISLPALTAEQDNNECNIDSTYIEIYSRGVKQVFEAMVSFKIISKNDVEMESVPPDFIQSILNKEFETKIFSKACFITGRLYTFKYNPSSFLRFSIYQLTFTNNEDLAQISVILKNVKRDHFRTNKSPTKFSWHKGSDSIFIIMETLLVNHTQLEHLK